MPQGDTPGLGPSRRPAPEALVPARRRRAPKAGIPGNRRRRLLVVSCVAATMLVVILARLVQVQVLDTPGYSDLADRQAVRFVDIPAMRGAVLDRNMVPLAVSDLRHTVWLDPRRLKDPWLASSLLAEVLGIDAIELHKRVRSKPGSRFVYAARQVDAYTADAVNALGLQGVHVDPEEARLRPSGEVAQGIVGSTDIDQMPLGGVELSYDHVLRAYSGSLVSRTARNGTPIPGASPQVDRPSYASDLILSVDIGLQWEVERALAAAVGEHDAAAAGAVVMDSRTGELLAVASLDSDSAPSPSAYSAPYVTAYEPGSVAKAFLVAIALEEDLTWVDEEWDLPTSTEFAGRVFREPFRLVDKQMSTAEALAHSSNVAIVRLAARTPPEVHRRYLHEMGLGRLTSPDGVPTLPGESAGSLRPASQWYGTDSATIGFGQGVSVTAVQLTAAYNVFANDGVYVSPRLVLARMDPKGRLVEYPESPSRRVLSSATALEMREMLSAVVEYGTGTRAAASMCAVAGKTGTAQKADLESGGYSTDRYVSSFAGFFPVDDPRVTVVVYLDEPNEHLAGLVAAPLFAEVVDATAQRLGMTDDC